MPKTPVWVFALVAIVYFFSVKVDTMDVDASQYASMSREMLHSDNWLQLHDRGFEYLDKPPFLFWVSALSMKVFGVNNFGYKFPSILFALWALYATYRLARLMYDEHTARFAALVLATCQGMFLMTNDVRCDTILMSWVVTAIWMVKEWDINGKNKYLFAGFAAAAFGMMTKGPIALMVPAFAFFSDWALHRRWGMLLKPQYIVGILIVTVLLIPVSIGLYQQFDLHPERMVNGQTHVSGLRFFYWSQSFGRITGESPWKNGADMSFLLVNMLWSFLPWIFLFLPALINNAIQLFRQKFRLQAGQEWISTGGFLLSYLSLGSSAYQLPHYIFVAFPLAAIVTAAYAKQLCDKATLPGGLKVIYGTAAGLSFVLLAVVLLLITYVFPAAMAYIILWGILAGAWLVLYFKSDPSSRRLLLPAVVMIVANVFLNLHVYPSLLDYQAGSQLGRYLKQHNIKPDNCIAYKRRDATCALAFYADGIYPYSDTITDVRRGQYVITMDEGLQDLKKYGFNYTPVTSGVYFKVSELTGEFLNPKTREQALKKYYMVYLQ